MNCILVGIQEATSRCEVLQPGQAVHVYYESRTYIIGRDPDTGALTILDTDGTTLDEPEPLTFAEAIERARAEESTGVRPAESLTRISPRTKTR